jgi:TIGR03009 family protein
VEDKEGFREHWVCDGKSIFELDYKNQQVKQRSLPPEMQGQRITDGPLPFLFGAKAQQLKDRFWIRVITPKDRKGEFWLEAVPKTQADAANFAMIHVILAESDFLPQGMILFHRNQFQTTFAFEKRETNWFQLDVINNPFVPRIPFGWKKVVEPLGAPAAQPLEQQATRQPPIPLRRR